MSTLAALRSVCLIDGSDPLEGRAGCSEFQVSALLIAPGTERIAEASGERRLVGRTHFVPETRGHLEVPFRFRGITGSGPHPSLGESGARGQRLALEPGGHLLELVGGRSCSVEVAGSNLDLDRCLEERRTTQLGVRGQLLRGYVQWVLEGFAYGRGCQRHVSLSQPHEGETGLRIPSGLVSREEGFLCAFDVSFQQPDPSELAQRPSELAPKERAQLFAGQKSLLLGLVARSPQPEDLGAVDAAAPVEASDGAGRAPPLHGFRPFLGEIVLRSPCKAQTSSQ